MLQAPLVTTDRTYFPMSTEHGDLYIDPPEDRQLFLIQQIANFDRRFAEVSLGSALIGLGGLYRDKTANLWRTFTDFGGFVERMIATPENMIIGSFPITYPQDLKEDKVLTITNETLPTSYRTGTFNLVVGAVACSALTEPQIEEHTNQIERCAKVLKINPKLGYHIFDVNTGKIVSKTDFEGLPEIVGAVVGLRLIFDEQLFDHPYLLKTFASNGAAQPSYLFDGVVIVDSRDLISEQRSKERSERATLNEWITRLGQPREYRQPEGSFVIKLVYDILFKPNAPKVERRKRKRGEQN